MSKMAVCYDTQSCIKCFACVISCSIENRQRLQRDYNYTVDKSMIEEHHNLNYLTVSCKETGKFPNVKQVAAFKHCMHCEYPKCMEICPTGAITQKENSAVVINQEICVGCRACKDACPYDVPVYSEETGKTYKCTMCYDRLDAGLNTACAAACPSVAIISGPWEEVRAEALKRAENYEKIFNKKYIVYGADKVNNTVGTLSYMTIAPLENRDDYLLPEDPTSGIADVRNIVKTVGAVGVALTAAAVAGHAVYSAKVLKKDDKQESSADNNHKELKDE